VSTHLDVELEYDVRVPLRDGAYLLGNLYRPTTGGPYPALLTYIPYLKDGWGGKGHGPLPALLRCSWSRRSATRPARHWQLARRDHRAIL
jgi:predicted acyl esterase